MIEPAHRVLLTILFIDPGPTKSGWVVMEVRSNGTVVPVQGGWRSMRDIAWLGGLMDLVWAKGGVVCMEYIDGGLYDRKRWRDLGETQRVEGDIRTTARMRGADDALLAFQEMPARRTAEPRTLFCVPATNWREQLCGRGTAKNCEIELYVLHLAGREVEVRGGRRVRLIDLPAAHDGASREHLYDAIGGALVMVEVFLGVKLKVPDHVRAAAERARATAREKAAVRRTLEGLGVDPAQARFANGAPVEFGKRRESRAVRAGRRAKTKTTRAMGKRR